MPYPVKGAIERLDTGQFIPFWFNPTEIEENYEVNWADIEIPGNPLPIKQYSGGSNHSIEMTLQLAQPMLDPSLPDAKKEVDAELGRMMQLSLPVAMSTDYYVVNAPPVLRLHYGSTVVKVVIQSWSIRRLFFDSELNTTVAEMDITFEQVSEVNF